MRVLLTILLMLKMTFIVKAQSLEVFADSIRRSYHIPELAYAVVSHGKIITLQCLGYKKINSAVKANINDRFRIGSNTKTVTGLIAAMLVKQGKISWDTKFFDLLPELKNKSNKAYADLTLLNLLSFRSNLIHWTYTNNAPGKDEITGNEEEQRLQFMTWVLKQKPYQAKSGLNFSNPGYTAAGLMLEKCSGKTYKELVKDLGNRLNISFGFGQPNLIDSLAEPWGHNEDLVPEPPADNFKLNWLLAAGNINVNLPDYCKFIQQHLQGLAGQSTLLSKQEFEFLHHGLPEFSIGWFYATDDSGKKCSYHSGNPGTFITKVYIYGDVDRAYLLFANSQTADTEKGMEVLLAELKKRIQG